MSDLPPNNEDLSPFLSSYTLFSMETKAFDRKKYFSHKLRIIELLFIL